MTLLAEIVKQQINYEPSVADKIQRILYRLDQGEPLAKFGLRHENNYCIMGLFADESKMGYWEHVSDEEGSRYYHILRRSKQRSYIFMHPEIGDYYSLINQAGTFNIKNLPADLYRDLDNEIGFNTYYSSLSSLVGVNDLASRKVVNELLARVIRSGVIFKK